MSLRSRAATLLYSSRAPLACLVLIGTVVLPQAAPAEAATLTVPTSPGCATITECVQATASPGDTIRIRPGTYFERLIDVSDAGLKVTGTDCGKPDRVVIDGGPPPPSSGPGENIFNVHAPGFRIECLTLRHGIVAINGDADADDLRVKKVHFTSQDENGVQLDEGSIGYSIEKSSFHGIKNSAVLATVDSGRISDNVVTLSGRGCLELGSNDLTVRGNTLRLCEDGPAVDTSDNGGSSDSLFEKNVVADSQGCFDLVGDRNDLLDNRCSNAGSAQPDDAYHVAGTDAVLRRNTSVGAEDNGFVVVGADAVIEDNRALGSGEGGFQITGDDAVVRRNRAENSLNRDDFRVDGANAIIEDNRGIGGLGGIEVNGANPVVRRNRMERSKDEPGVRVACSTDCTAGIVEDNVVLGASEDADGIFISNLGNPSAGFLVEGNRVQDATDDGFDINLSDATIRRNKAHRNSSQSEHNFRITGNGNQIEANESTFSGTDGFIINGNNNTVIRNLARDNAVDGIDIQSGDGNVVELNTTRNNQAEGIENSAAVTNTDLIRNASRGNRIDCANDGGTDTVTLNTCADGSDFATPSGGVGTERFPED